MSKYDEDEEEIVEKEETKKHRFVHFIFLVIIIIIGLIFYSKYLGTSGIIVKEYRVTSNFLDKDYSGLKIVHFSDLLYKSTIDKNDLNELVNKINNIKPDIVVFTGDLASPLSKIKEDDINILKESLSKIEAKISKYAIYGDNDYKLSKYEEIMNKSNFIILNNSYDELYYNSLNPIYIVGLPSSIKEKSDLNTSFSFYNDENRKYIITLVHDGSTIKSIDESDYEVDLILGGHNLGGLVRIPFIGGIINQKNSYKYKNDYNEKGITKIFMSSGLGTDQHDYRLLNKPSFNLYRLKSK